MDPFAPFGRPIAAPQLPAPKKPKKPDPAARRMKALDYVSLLLGVEPAPDHQELPPPIGYRFPDRQVETPYMPPPSPNPPPTTYQTPGQQLPIDEQYKQHVVRMRGKLGY